MSEKHKVLIFGASYGSLLATKLMMAGHDATVVCREETAATFNADGSTVRIPVKGRDGHVEIRSQDLPGSLNAAAPNAVDPAAYDLVALAMQEPQYSADGVRDLLLRTAEAKVPAMSIMNMPPPPYLKRIDGVDVSALDHCYVEPRLWDAFDPDLMTLASPDPQAFRPPEEPATVLQVTLPTNFKTARFASDTHTAMLRRIEADIDAARFDAGDGPLEIPVKLRVAESLFVPLAKWAMLLTGNYRCVQPDAPRSIKEAVHSDPAEAERIYEWVVALCVTLGADRADMVPFHKYAAAASGLAKPSSAARALFGGALHIERVDAMVQGIAAAKGLQLDAVDDSVRLVNERLALNAAAKRDVA